jgi:hypothetical protein
VAGAAADEEAAHGGGGTSKGRGPADSAEEVLAEGRLLERLGCREVRKLRETLASLIR